MAREAESVGRWVCSESEEEGHLLEQGETSEGPVKMVPGNDGKWWTSKPLLLTLVVTAWMLSIAKYTDELGPIFVSAPVQQVRYAGNTSQNSEPCTRT